MSTKRVLRHMNSPSMLASLSPKQLTLLAEDVRSEIIETVSNNGGHLSPNLGTVELTIALLTMFQPPKDKIVWDVGHQGYAYKILTDRKDTFHTIRLEDGISGFPKTAESRYDSFVAGHASTSIAAAFGIESAKNVLKKSNFVVAVIGDGAMTGGLAYEALNNVGRSKSKLIIIINDNDMSISKSEGALSRYLSAIRANPQYFKVKSFAENTLESIPFVGKDIRDIVSNIKYAAKQIAYPTTFFEQLGFDYLGPVDGHNIKSLCDVLKQAKLSKKPVILHIKTIKGKGYPLAEKNSGVYHGVSKFDPTVGIHDSSNTKSFSDVFGETLLELAQKDPAICAITAAMESSTGLTPFAKRFRKEGRFFDVGIAEGYATTFAAGLSAGGCKPVFAVYSTFLQRAYDQILHDASIESRNVVFAIDRAGIVGSDGETHQGVFDVAFLSTIPNMTIYSPTTYAELRRDLKCALYHHNSPVAVRYPRGSEPKIPTTFTSSDSTYDHFKQNSLHTVVITYGKIFAYAAQAAEETGCGIIKLNRILPIDDLAIQEAMNYKNIIFAEEGMLNGSISMQFATKLMLLGYKGTVRIRAIENFVPQSSVESSLEKLGLSKEGICKLIKEVDEN